MSIVKANLHVKILSFISMFFFMLFFSSTVDMHAHAIKKNVIIFIHGTFLPGLALLNPYKTYTQTLSSSDLYIKTLNTLRNDHAVFHDTIMLEEGLQKISPALLSLYNRELLTPAQSKLGAYQAIGAFHALATHCSPLSSQNDYYTFGFLGALSDIHRRETSEILYHKLLDLKNQYNKDGYDPAFTLVAYSHGGTIALHLADVEEEEQKSLSLENIFLVATPLQKETAILSQHALFKNVFNIYSDGDTVQPNDVISTSSCISYRTLNALLDNKSADKPVVDLRWLADQDPQAFGHTVFWFFDRYAGSWVDAKTQKIFDLLSPLPLVILIPVLQESLASLTKQQLAQAVLDVNIFAENEQCCLQIIDQETKSILGQSRSISQPLQQAQGYAVRSWMPYAQSSDSYKAVMSLLTALRVACAS